MTSPISFYFDFMSPYAYLGSVEVERLAARLGLTVDWRPILLGVSVLKVMGLKGAADTPLKRDYVRNDAPRLARYLGIPFDRARMEPMQSLPAMRAFSWLNGHDPELAKNFARAVYRSQWAEARDVSDAAAVLETAAALGVDAGEMARALRDDEVKARLRAEVDAAIAAGIFGVPSFVFDGEMFWGVDRLPMLERWIAERSF